MIPTIPFPHFSRLQTLDDLFTYLFLFSTMALQRKPIAIFGRYLELLGHPLLMRRRYGA